MKLLPSKCTLVASTLSSLYTTYNATTYSSAQPLEPFLDQNGILLTLCMRYNGLVPWMECSMGKKETKISASWISKEKTRGFRVIGPPIDLGPPVGLVLKPTALRVRCMFPADAATDARDEGGCGPNSGDARYGSKGYDHAKHWWNKVLLREKIVQYKNSQFGQNRSWDSIPCVELCPNDNSLGAVLGQVNVTTEKW